VSTDRLLRWAGAGLVFYALWLLVDNGTAKGLPPGILVAGIVTGSLYGLNALGIVLIYRANRIVNFAQAELGSIAAVTTIELVKVAHVPYFLAVLGGIVFALVIGAGISTLVIRRFANAPRLIVAVATIGLAQILLGLSILIPIVVEKELSSGGFEFPLDWRLTIYPVIFSGAHITAMIAVPLVMVALAAFLRYTHYGTAIRAAADNGDRAALVGIPVPRLSTIVWALAGGMSALAVILRTQIVGFVSFSGVSGGGTALLMIVLAASVLARMESMPRAVVAGIGIGIFQQGASWHWPRTTIVDALMLVVILVGLLIQKDAFNRAAETGISTWKALREIRPIPSELTKVREVVAARWAIRFLLGAVVLTLPLWATISQEEAAALVAIYSIVALSLLMLTGWAGHISLGQFALVGFGAAATGKLYGTFGWDWTWAALGGIVTAAVAALVIGLPALRIKGPFLAVTTLAFGVTASSFFLEERYVPWFVSESRVFRPVLFGTIDLDTSWKMYFFCVVCLAGAFLLVKHLRYSRPGRALIAVRDNELAAESVSVDAPRIKLLAFVLSGALAGFAGAIYLISQTGVQAGAFTPDVSIRLFSMVVIGGLGSIPGAILGAVYVRGAEFFLPPEWELLASGIGILVLLMFAPEGLGGLVYAGRDRFLRWVAKRNDLYVPSLLADVRLDDSGQRIGRVTEDVTELLDLAAHELETHEVTEEGVTERRRRRREPLVASSRRDS
jgi:branched-chain amino acid transport system permease protein